MPTYVRERHWLVDQNHAGWRLDSFLANRVPRLSRTQVKRIVARGGVSLEPTRRAKASSTLRVGDRVTLRQRYQEPEVDDSSVAVLHEDDDVLVVDKPAGMLVHPSARIFANTVVEWGRRTSRGPLWVVHRLDRETSGVLAMARRQETAAALVADFEAGRVEKRYLAVVVDSTRRYQPGDDGCFDAPLGLQTNSPLPSLLMGPGALDATTLWRCDSRTGDLAWMDVQILGGRQHQIRVHFALAGTPLVGDKLYGHGAEFYMAWCDGKADRGRLRANRHALHARRLTIRVAGVDQTFVADPPSFFAALRSGESST